MTESPAMQAARRIFRPTNDQAVEQVAGLIEALRQIEGFSESNGMTRVRMRAIARSAILNVTKGD